MNGMLSMAAVMTGDGGDSNTYLILGGLCIVAVIIVVVLGILGKRNSFRKEQWHGNHMFHAVFCVNPTIVSLFESQNSTCIKWNFKLLYIRTDKNWKKSKRKL